MREVGDGFKGYLDAKMHRVSDQVSFVGERGKAGIGTTSLTLPGGQKTPWTQKVRDASPSTVHWMVVIAMWQVLIFPY